MSKEVELLKYYLTTKPKMSINDLRDFLKMKTDDEIMRQLVEILESAVKSFNFNAHPSNYYIMGTCLDYLEYTPSKLKLKDEHIHGEITYKLLKLINPIETLLENPGTNKSYLTYKNNARLLESARDRIVNYKHKYQQNIGDDLTPELFDFMYDLVFKYQRIEYVKKVLNEKPNLINVSDRLGKPLLEYIVEKYLNIMHDDKLVDIFYFENLVTLFSKGYNNKDSINRIQNMIYKENNKVKNELFRSVNRLKRMEFSMFQIARCFKMQHLYPTHVQNINYKFKVNNFFEDDIVKAVDKTYMYDPKGYVDMRTKNVITIDDYNCIFREDAVSFNSLSNGNFELGIYISDVDAKIGEGSKLDLEALKRAVSTDETYQYLFPKEFLNTQMSLLKNEDHPVLAFIFTIDKNMKIFDFKVDKAIVNIKKNYNYNDVKDMINKQNGDHQLFKNLYSVACAIEDVRTNKANITIRNHPFINHGNPGEHIISELSVFLNSHMANYFYNNDLPFIYRNDSYNEHDDIVKEAEDAMLNTKVVEAIKEYNAPTQLSSINKGFETLARRAYGSVTNPGRWYDALVNQRLIKKLIIENKMCDRNTLMHYNALVPFVSECLNERNELGYYYKNEVNQNGLTKSK